MNGWSAFWLAWVAAGIVVETAALAGKRAPRDTLSQNIQWLVRVGHPIARRVGVVGWFVFAVWFADHIWG